MARPIRWDNIQVPSDGGAGRTFDAGADRISESINNLRQMAQEQTAINQANYENQKEANTQNVIDQLNRATSQEALSGVDVNQFGNQIDRGAINESFRTGSDRLDARARDDAKFDLETNKFNNLLEQQKINNDRADRQLALDQQKANQYGFKYEGGQIFREDPNTGKVESVGTYKLPVKNTNTATGLKLSQNLMTSQYTDLTTMKSFGGSAEDYSDFLTTQLAERTDLDVNAKNKIREEAIKFHEDYFNNWTPDQRRTYETQQRYGVQATSQLQGEMASIQEQASQVLGARPEVFNYKNDDSMSVDSVLERIAPNYEWVGGSGKEVVAGFYQTVADELGYQPTGAELEHILVDGDSKSTWTTQGEIRAAAERYKALISDTEKVRKAHKVLNLMDNATSNVQAQIMQNEKKMSKQIRSGKAFDLPPALSAQHYDVAGAMLPLREEMKKLR